MKIKDFFFAGFLFGITSTLIGQFYIFILKLFIDNLRTPWGDSTELFFNPPELYMLPAKIMGYLLSFNNPIIIGISLCLLVKLTGKDYVYVKSIVLSMIVTFFNIGVLYPALGLNFLKHSITTYYVAFSAVLLFGTILGYSVKKFTDFD